MALPPLLWKYRPLTCNIGLLQTIRGSKAISNGSSCLSHSIGRRPAGQDTYTAGADTDSTAQHAGRVTGSPIPAAQPGREFLVE